MGGAVSLVKWGNGVLLGNEMSFVELCFDRFRARSLDEFFVCVWSAKLSHNCLREEDVLPPIQGGVILEGGVGVGILFPAPFAHLARVAMNMRGEIEKLFLGCDGNQLVRTFEQMPALLMPQVEIFCICIEQALHVF